MTNRFYQKHKERHLKEARKKKIKIVLKNKKTKGKKRPKK